MADYAEWREWLAELDRLDSADSDPEDAHLLEDRLLAAIVRELVHGGEGGALWIAEQLWNHWESYPDRTRWCA